MSLVIDSYSIAMEEKRCGFYVYYTNMDIYSIILTFVVSHSDSKCFNYAFICASISLGSIN